MKRITLYLHILMLLLITACSNEEIIVPTPLSGADGQTCEVSFWASIPETSSASRGTLGEATATSVETLSLLVFDAASGLYLYESEATLSDQTLDGEIHKGKYTAHLQLSDAPRIIHFVANVDDVPFQANEIAVLSQLSKSNNEDAYWQKVEVQSITAQVDESGKVVTNELTDDNGNITTIAVANIPTEMKNVKLVRNFARITLSAANGSGFNLAGFVLVNTATKGTVAPYMRQADDKGSYFPNYDTENDENGSAMTKYEALIAAGYAGVQPSDATIDLTVPEATSDLYTNKPKYLYERTQEEDPMFIIAKRNMGNDQYRYYKIDIMKVGGTGEKDDYYKILRNFSYDITINSVEGNGYESPADAAQATASNNLSASLELKDLTNIAYGDERLFVSKTEIVWTSADPITFKYMYQKNGQGSNATVNSLIIGEAKNSSGAVCSNTYTINSSETDAEGYSTISITHTGLPETGYKEQEVTIKAGTLMRTINLILINPYASQVGCSATSGLSAVPTTTPEIPLTVGSPVYVYFSMPSGLPESIFPLTFILSPEAHSITPTGGDMPVTSLLTNSNTTMQGLKYGFEKVITWDDYKNNANTGMIVECPFKTSLAESATNIYVYNEYFNFPLKTYFINPRAFKNLTLDNEDRYGTGQNVEISFEMNSLAPVTITVTEGTTTSTITHTPTAIGKQLVSYETETWNGRISVKLEADGYDSVSATGATRNKLFVKLTVNSNTDNINNGTYEISAYRSTNYNYNQLLISATKAEWAEGVEITYNNLTEEEITTDNTIIYFRGQTGTSGRFNPQPTYGYANSSVKQLVEGITITIG